MHSKTTGRRAGYGRGGRRPCVRHATPLQQTPRDTATARGSDAEGETMVLLSAHPRRPLIDWAGIVSPRRLPRRSSPGTSGACMHVFHAESHLCRRALRFACQALCLVPVPPRADRINAGKLTGNDIRDGTFQTRGWRGAMQDAGE